MDSGRQTNTTENEIKIELGFDIPGYQSRRIEHKPLIDASTNLKSVLSRIASRTQQTDLILATETSNLMLSPELLFTFSF